MKSENPLFTTTEAAAYLGITRSYLYKLMMWRKVPYYKPRGKLCFFDKADLDEYNRRYRSSPKTNWMHNPKLICCESVCAKDCCNCTAEMMFS